MARIQKLYSCLRILMTMLCGIIFLSGFAFLGFGVWMKYDSVYYVEVTGLFYEHLVNLAYICMGMGALLCLVGLIGLCAAKRENWCLITLSFSCLAVLFCTKVFGTIFVFAYRDLGVVMVREVSRNTLLTAYNGSAASDPVSTVWNAVMMKYKCCGFENSIQDFVKSKFTTNTGLKYPKICCIDKTSSACDGNNTTEGLFYPEEEGYGYLLQTRGCKAFNSDLVTFRAGGCIGFILILASCFGKLVDGIQEKFYATGSTASIVCVLEFLAMMISVVLFLKRSNEEYHKNQGTSAV